MRIRGDAERAPFITDELRRDPPKLTTPRPLLPTFHPARPGTLPLSSRLHHESGLTLRITRPPAPLLLMTSFVSRVACMRLLGRLRARP